MILSKVNNISSKASQVSVKKIEIKDLEPNLDRAEVLEENKEDRKAVNHDNKDLYSPTSTPLMWSSELYVKEVMSMKRRPGILEEKRWYEGNKVNEIVKFKSKLEGENKALKEQMSSMQVKMEIEQQEVTALKQELEQMRITRVEKLELVKEEDTTQRQEIQLVLANLEAKENQLKDRIEEAKSWSQVVSGSSNKQKEIIEKQIKIQIKEE